MSTRTDRHERWLTELTALPTVAGREDQVIAWVERWVERRPDLRLRSDKTGNLVITRRGRRRHSAVWITAHMDHPGFVVTGRSGRIIEWQFLGGVLPQYFEGAPIEMFDDAGPPHRATIDEVHVEGRVRTGTARLAKPSPQLALGSIGRWAFRASALGVKRGQLHAPACDDLAGVAAALASLDDLRRRPEAGHVGVLLTRAEEVGFIGAIAACRDGTIPSGTKLICIEMSPTFPESPIGAGPIVRVGDASSVFSPTLTNQLSELAARHTRADTTFRFQRKLMAGGSCEATAFSAYGFESSCLCLALGNHHNMVGVGEVAEGQRPAKLAPEFIDLDDFHGLVRLITSSVRGLDGAEASSAKSLDQHYQEWNWVLS